MIDKVNDKLSIIDDTNIEEVWEIIPPIKIIDKLPLTPKIANFIQESRQTISDIIHLKDHRVMVVVGPCSIHNPLEALEYAKKLKEIEDNFPNLYIVMRTYFEKPRTHIGWKWLINDPNLDWSFDIETWLETARKLLLEINEMWIPTATEFLDTISPQYIADLISWWAIWARTTESQLHRELASGLSAPIWFKNWTDWWISVAINAIKASSKSHHFLWTTKEWRTALIKTTWNKNLHTILRWWEWIINYNKESVDAISLELDNQWIQSGIMIDVSHANSNKDYRNQPKVSSEVAKQISDWNKKIMSLMIESNTNEWNQSFDPLKNDKTKLQKWISITDSCVSFETTIQMLEELEKATASRNKK